MSTPYLPPSATLVDWLLDSDHSLRWQVMRDLLDAPAAQWRAERARVATDGFGAALLAAQGADGSWGDAAWNHGWDSTMHVLTLLHAFGLDPDSAQAHLALGRVAATVTWQGDPLFEGRAYFTGEVEPCINGQVAAAGAYFGQDVRSIIDRLLTEQLPDGGWNCDAPTHSTRSSFNSTICVLEALLEFEHAFGAQPDVMTARRRGEAYLLDRRMQRRLSTGELITNDRKRAACWQHFAFPTWWHYDVLRGLLYLRKADVAPDERVSDASELLLSRRHADGHWPLDVSYPGVLPVPLETRVGEPNRWITFRALLAMRWYAAGAR